MADIEHEEWLRDREAQKRAVQARLSRKPVAPKRPDDDERSKTAAEPIDEEEEDDDGSDLDPETKDEEE